MLPTLLLIMALTASQGNVETASSPEREVLPAEFRHDRVFVVPRYNGKKINFFTDTGGGWNAVSRSTAEKFEVAIETIENDEGGSSELIAFPKFDDEYAIPAPDPAYYRQGRLLVAADDAMAKWGDGFLGGRWFAGKIWEFDYPQKRLSRLRSWTAPKGKAHRQALGFQVDARKIRTMHFPSFRVSIDGEDLDMLLDTGATATLTEESAPVFGLKPGDAIGTSFIEHSVFARWTDRHPDWRVLERADQNHDVRRMIEVPEIVVAGHRIGPVWFAEQPDGAFQQYMAAWMDRPTSGAIGGSAFRYLRLIIDYPGATAYFYRDAPTSIHKLDSERVAN